MIQKVKVNLIPAYDLTLPVVHFKQYDQTDSGVGKQIQLELYSGDDIYEIPSGSIVTFQGTKLDKTGYQYEVASYEGNVVIVDIKGQMTVLSGSHEAELRITKGDSIISTTRLVMDIEEAALADDTAISETDLPLLYEAIEAVDQIVELERKIDTKQDKLVSGTNIKTIGGESLLGSGDIAISTDYEDLTSKPSINGTTLTGNRVLVSKINNTSPNSDGSITITTVSKDASDIATNTASIATNTANIATNTANIATNTSNISKKQDTLVSGTNIKTVNGNSLLGSGNISIDGIKVWTCTLSTTWTQDSTNGYYYQSVTVSGITSSDYPTLDVVTSGTLSNIQALQNEWSKIVQAETSTNTIKFYAKEATTTSLTVLVKR